MRIRVLVVLALGGCAACASWKYEATDGGETVGNVAFAGGDAATRAVEQSARHDIPCDEVSMLDYVHLGTDYGVYLVEGCGQRVAYALVPTKKDSSRKRCTLISRISIQER